MRPQFTNEERTWLALQYHRRRGQYDFKAGLVRDFQVKFPMARIPSKNNFKKIWEKFTNHGTVMNLNSNDSPGQSFSGRKKTSTSTDMKGSVQAVLDRDALKEHGDATVSPVSSCRRNALDLDKSAWWRLAKELKYHPYKMVHRQMLKPQDLARRLDYSNWLLTQTDQQLEGFCWSDESNFHPCGQVNTHNVRRYATLKISDPVNGGRPDHFAQDHPVKSPHLMVFAGITGRGQVFVLKVYKGETMTGPAYHSLLQYTVLPQLKAQNGGTLDGLTWTQDVAPCHVTDRNMAYFDRQFGDRVVSRRPVSGRDWPARSPDHNPYDIFLWPYLKTKVYTPRPTILDQLEANIRREVAALDPVMVRRAAWCVRGRAAKCVANGGGFCEN